MNNKFIFAITYFSKLAKSLIPLFALIFLNLFLFTNLAYSLPSCHTLTQFLTAKRNPGVNCLANCNSMPSGVTVNEGVNCLYACDNLPSQRPIAQIGKNCAFRFDGYVMPFCNSVPNSLYGSTASYFLPAGTEKKPRLNCLDLIDLPLCTMVSSPSLAKNCAPTCSSLNPATLDKRIFNRDCIRFCNALEPDVTASGDNCIIQKCHQLIGTGVKPLPSINPTNCEISNCTTLSEHELKHSSLYSGSWSAYCSNTAQKCMDFNLTQLNAIKSGYDSATNEKSGPLYKFCQLHSCRIDPATSCAPQASDDIAKISENSTYSSAYINAVIKTTQPNSSLNELCIIKPCKGIVEVPFPCTGAALTTMDAKCTEPCIDNSCIKKVDCDSSTLSDSDRSLYCDGIPGKESEPSSDNTNVPQSLVNKAWFYLPKPMDKSYNVNQLGVVDHNSFRRMQPELCYSVDDLLANNFGYEESAASFLTGIMKLFTGRDFRPYFHNYLTMDTRSPNYCYPALRHGARGLGYGYLCGRTSATSKPDMEHVGYIDNLSTSWSSNSQSPHKVRVCLRYNNSMIPWRTCGARECGITCFCEDCSTVCGSDVCRDVIVNENNPRACEDPTTASGDCVSQIGGGADIDSYIRVRAVGFPEDNRVCVMLDWKGGLAYSGMFMDGTESLEEDTKKCLSGTYDKASNKCINGKNSNDDRGSASVWRALGLIKYIDGNTTFDGSTGIIDKNSIFYKEESCIKHQIRASPPNLYNLANFENSPGLFSPPLIINLAKKRKGGATSLPENSAHMFGKTDFNQSELEILFGNDTSLISLDIGKNGSEIGASIDPNSKKTINTRWKNKDFSATIYGKKTSDPLGSPQYCIFRELRDKNNALLDPPSSIGCIRRNLPVIDNCDIRDGLCTILPPSPRETLRQKIILSKDLTPANNNYKNIDVRFKYLANYIDANHGNLICGGNVLCSNELSIKFNLVDRKQMSYCYTSAEAPEGYPICFTRDVCSVLNMECMENEVIISSGNVLDSVLSKHEECYKDLLTCNKKKNITSKDYDPNKFNANSPGNYYGWFNEVCITKGFNHKLRRVYAYKFDTQNGKCIVDTSKSIGDCSAGGKMPNCPCTEDLGGATPENVQAIAALNRTERTETLHEAGLCVDIKLPDVCPSVNYLTVENDNTDDRFFIINSLNKLAASQYNDLTGVHTSHQYRTEGKISSPAIPLRGHAEFNATVAGAISRGNCNGFWKYKMTSGAKVYPQLSCNLIQDVPAWNNTLENDGDACVRYSCPTISSAGLDNPTGLYDSFYGVDEIGENKGLGHGYAYWSQANLTTDFAITQNATACITGFKKVGSTTTFSFSASAGIDSTKKTLANASLFSAITGYSDGTSPSRICNQIGEWQAVTNSCQRITCPAINPGITPPSSAIDKTFWQKSWELSGGGKFAEGNASRSSTTTITANGLSSRISGTCETGLGYYSPTSGSPTLDCDYLGNWTNLQNGCLNDCSAILRADTNSGNGFATWTKASLLISESVRTVSGSCSDSGYYNYPYPHRRKPDGTKYSLVATGADYTSSIPLSIASDTRTAATTAGAANTAPQRLCTKSIYSGQTTSQWSGVSATCISNIPNDAFKPNGCVTGIVSDDFMSDERIGAGVTQHTIRNANGDGTRTVNIPWSRKSFGEYEIRYCDSSNSYCQNSIANPDSSHNSNTYYSASRTNGRFVLTRYCNINNKKWDDPIPYCIANNGDVGNSLNFSAATSSTAIASADHYILGLNGTIASTCNSGYTGNTSAPNLKCLYGQNLVVDTLQLTKTDNNTCTRYCTINAQGAPSGSSYSLTGAAGTYLPGNTVSLSCGSGVPCGAQSVTATCSADGTWSIPQPTCRTCNGCSRTSGRTLGAGTTGTFIEACHEESFNIDCMFTTARDDTDIDDSEFTRSHGQVIGVAHQYGPWYCGYYANGKHIGTYGICGSVEYICNDGTWNYYRNLTHEWECDRKPPNWSKELDGSGDCTVY